MGSGIYIAMSGAIAQTESLDVTANNVANAGTAGFKAERITFGQALKSAGDRKDSAYVTPMATTIDPTAGVLTRTGNPLDLAISGDGYFSVQTPNGARYTRAGNFRTDAQGTLVTASGLAVRSKQSGAPITVPQNAKAVSVDANGTVRAHMDTKGAGGDEGTPLGTLEIRRFARGELSQEGATLFAAKGAGVESNAEVISGALEGSNFNVVRGVVDLVKISRTYEALHRMIETYREVEERTARNGAGSL